jgi:hypothetical protein
LASLIDVSPPRIRNDAYLSSEAYSDGTIIREECTPCSLLRRHDETIVTLLAISIIVSGCSIYG